MNQDAKRATGRGVPSERHAIGITRMCLRSGSVQLPFALSGSLPEGELLVHDAEADEPIVLWSEPPRRLAGLAPLFERHEVQVNDQLVLEVRGDDVRIAVAKRPRRSRPKVTPSTWASHRDEPRPDAAPQPGDDADGPSTPAQDGGRSTPWEDATADADGHADADADVAAYRADSERDERHEPSGRSELSASDGHDAARTARRTGPAQVRPPDEATATPGRRAAWARPIDGVSHDELDDDDVPRAPRVTVRPASDARAASRDGAGSPAAAGDARASDRGPTRRSGGGPFAGLVRRARGWFGGDAGPRDDDRGPSDDDTEPEARDWLQGWDVDDDASDADPDAFDTTPALGTAAPPARAAGRLRREAPDAPHERSPGTPERTEEPAQEPAEAPLEEPPEQPLAEAPQGAARRRRDAAADRAPDAPARDSAEATVGGVGDDERDARAARVKAAGPAVPVERPDILAEEPPEPPDETAHEATHATTDEATDEPVDEAADEPATPVPHGSAARTPLFPDPPFHAAADEDGQAPGAASATHADSDSAPAETAGPQAGSADAPPVDAPPERGATLPSGVPIRAERFLGGDLRTRLLRFLTSPEMPLIAKTDLIAKRFDLEPATAQEMLEDIADDPPDGLRLTVVRQGAWRIERRSA